MANTYFFTGFPGFIAGALIKKMIQEGYGIERIHLLVLPSMLAQAQDRIDEIVASENITEDKFNIISGDITKPDLDIEPEINNDLQNTVTHVFHLAAVYDLAVPEEIAYNVNVNGTKRVNDWVLTLNKLKRYIYFSTAYVSGNREGRILETELDMDQSFKNHYEKTKFEAEKLVRQIVDQVPTTIIRPGIVVGDSKTGETIKFDGPYFLLNLFESFKLLPILPYFGSGAAEVNCVPVDYIIDATLYLGHAEVGANKTYHLTDPQPHKVRNAYTMFMQEFLGRKPMGTVPLLFAKTALTVPLFRQWVRVEKEAMEYFTCMSYYDCSQAQKDLVGSSIQCPNLKDYVKQMVAFYKAHKDDPTKQIKIL